MSTQVHLEALIEDLDVDCGFIFDANGVLQEAFYLDLAENFAAMSSMIATMCHEIVEDFELGKLDDVILNTDSGLFYIKKFEDHKYLGLVTYDASKLALIHGKLQNLQKETETL